MTKIIKNKYVDTIMRYYITSDNDFCKSVSQFYKKNGGVTQKQLDALELYGDESPHRYEFSTGDFN